MSNSEYVIENIWTFKTKNFVVSVDAVPCMSMLDDDMAGYDEIVHSVDQGTLQHFDVKATVTCLGAEIACNYLGSNIYKDYSDFRDHVGINVKSRADGGNYGSYFSDMVKTVIDEARTTLNTMSTLFKPLKL